ncbi:MAG: FAD-dependent pyridine nucleotide-disulfide oxidoreductase [Methanomicrobiales archaeon 53_19]|uniref:NAD(P)/FAD-dependent oxidoreductase n=1 Tax=Methanocalculus sp. TaxID=2004547 RepID=UPI0007495A43|nr:NAD(P)/FAD-dependent oxidoreductase [Methanocalculus sp.]KUK69550.1 MAG: FAD-dependent pyridine nucleotide-disulfide oxidoreductase [Methanocalculus sp. 52_23]KUL03010.1 MAG: FAD-dependent pyridine nucleotide-disulfide oxidoreductase [Methanomicrobiales archaeon 53_19]HIJ06191.1 NAD(P)/FAD-dependent oxidoreductase [Methanocalculus sp.]
MILVLGGGPAGRMAAMKAAGAGEEVVLIEKRSLGGQCLHDGCMLVCGLNDCARMIRSAALCERSGITRGMPEVRFPELIAGVHSIQQTIATILDEETKDAGVQVIYGAEAAIIGGKAVVNGEVQDADMIIIATGSRPHIPDIPGITLPGVYTPHTLKEMKQLPKRIAIIGGGVMAAEFAYIFSSFGTETHIISRSEFLHQIPPRLKAAAQKDLGDVTIHENTRVLGIGGEDAVSGIDTDGFSLDCDCVLLAAGLIPNSEKIEGVEKGRKGEILVNNRFETSIPGIFACGDVIGEPGLTPVARLQGFAAADAAIGCDHPVDLSYLPRSMSLGYEYAWMEPVSDEGITYTLPGPAGPGTFWSLPERRTGISSLMVDEETGEILSFAEASPDAGVMAMYLGFMAEKGFSVRELAGIFEVHPTADGMYPTIRYASAHLNKKQREDPDQSR